MFRSKRSRDGHQYNQYIEKWDIGGVNNACDNSSCTLSAHTLDLNKLAKKDNAHLNQSYGLWKSIIVTALVQSENAWQQDFIKLKYDI